MSASDTWHRLVSIDGRTGVCTICGPTRVRPARPGRGAQCLRPSGRRYPGKRETEWRPTARQARKYLLRRKYGITVEDYDRLLVAQSGRCAICSLPLTQPAVDHDHQTGLVRGLLCSKCNLGLGFFEDDPQRLALAIDYLLP